MKIDKNETIAINCKKRVGVPTYDVKKDYNHQQVTFFLY